MGKSLRDAEVRRLRMQAERYRSLAESVTDQEVAQRIRKFADELDARADELAGNSH